EEPLKLRDLYKVIKSLKDNDYDVSTWSGLCLALGLSQPTINTIKKDEMDSNDRLRSCLYQWLNRIDQVDEFGGATWASLVTALENIGQKPVAEKLKERTK
uniref:Death domain-containing protein n=1 Tax=Amphimedon queenslandica TaxID=400682 RepID=A0A1X7SUS2_AMPQE